MKYKWMKDAKGRVGMVEAKHAGKLLARLEKRDGGILPRAILTEAIPKDSPIHGWFEWDDTKAADIYRVEQARHMVQQLVVVYRETDADEPIECRAFLNVSDEETGRQYVSTAKVLSDDELRKQVIAAVMANLERCEKKLHILKGFAKVLDSLKRARLELQKENNAPVRRGK